jgi:hypothetical protein
VLVVTKIDEKQAQPDQGGSVRAIDILAERLPGVPAKPDNTDTSAAPSHADSDAKPKPVTPQASVSGAGPITAAASADAKPIPKPVKATVDPKPQPVLQDNPQDSPH